MLIICQHIPWSYGLKTHLDPRSTFKVITVPFGNLLMMGIIKVKPDW